MVCAKNVTQYELKMQAERKWIGTGMVDAYLLLFFSGKNDMQILSST